MNSRLLISMLLLGAVALACGSRTHSEASVVTTEKKAVPKPGNGKPSGKASTTSGTANSTNTTIGKSAAIASAFTVSADSTELRFSLDLRNSTKKSVELAFPSGQEYDFIVIDSVGREVYRWGRTRMFTQSLQNRVLGAGESLRFDERTPATTLPHGSYVAVAMLRSSNYPLQERVEFTLQ